MALLPVNIRPIRQSRAAARAGPPQPDWLWSASGSLTPHLIDGVRGTPAVSQDTNNQFRAAETVHGVAGFNTAGTSVSSLRYNAATDVLSGLQSFSLLVWFVFDPTAFASGQWMNFRTDNQHSLDVFSHTSTSLTWGSDWAGAWNGASQKTLSGLVAGQFVCIGVSVKQDGASFYHQGQFAGTKSGTTFTTSSSSVNVANGTRMPLLGQAAFRRALDDLELARYTEDPGRLFASRRIWIPVSAAGGLFSSLTEPASASDVVASSYVGNAASAESATASDSLASAVSGIAALAEAATATDAQTAAYIAIASIAEAAAATDLLSAVATFSRAVAEAATASDTITTGIQAFATQAEAASALDAITAVATLVAAVVEAATAADVQAATAQLVALLTEPAVAADSVAAATPGVHNVSMVEIAAALDALAAWVAGGAQPLSAAPLVHRLQESVRAARMSSARPSRLNGRTR